MSAVALACVALTPAARAAEETEGQPPTRRAASACERPELGALSRVVCQLAHQLPAEARSALVVAGPASGVPNEQQAAALGVRVASVLAGRLGKASRSAPDAVPLATARALAGSYGALVYVQLAVQGGKLEVTADLYQVPKGFWDRVREPRPDPSAHGFAAAPADAEVRSFLPRVPLVAGTVHKVPAPERNAVALACGDLDTDGASELIVVGRRRIVSGRLRGGRLAALHEAAWSELSPVSPEPLREPIAATAFGNAGLAVGSSDRAELVILDGALRESEHRERALPWHGVGCLDFTAVGLEGAPAACAASGSGLVWRDRGPVDAVAGASISQSDGSVRSVAAARLQRDATVLLQDSGRRMAQVAGLGAQLALGDLDGDGQPELIAGSDTLDAKGDAVVVHTWQADGQVTERYRIAVPDGVHALAVCPWQGVGLAPLAIATHAELWVVL